MTLTTSCFISKHKEIDEDGKYGYIRIKIIGIDSTSRNYIIRAQHKDAILKIVSSKQGINCKSKKVAIGRKYTLNLTSIFARRFGRIKISAPDSDPYLHCAFYNGEDICIEADSCIQCKRDVFESSNLSGLCLIK
jgi:hypothetical protein